MISDNYTLEEFFDYKNFSAGFNRQRYQSWAYAMQTTITWLDITEVQPSSGVKILYLCDDNIYTGYVAYAEGDEKPANPILVGLGNLQPSNRDLFGRAILGRDTKVTINLLLCG
jgi:hypothetical protein